MKKNKLNSIDNFAIGMIIIFFFCAIIRVDVVIPTAQTLRDVTTEDIAYFEQHPDIFGTDLDNIRCTNRK